MNPIITEILLGQIQGLEQSADSFDMQRTYLQQSMDNLAEQSEQARERAALLQGILEESGYTPPEPEPEPEPDPEPAPQRADEPTQVD